MLSPIFPSNNHLSAIHQPLVFKPCPHFPLKQTYFNNLKSYLSAHYLVLAFILMMNLLLIPTLPVVGQEYDHVLTVQGGMLRFAIFSLVMDDNLRQEFIE